MKLTAARKSALPKMSPKWNPSDGLMRTGSNGLAIKGRTMFFNDFVNLWGMTFAK